MNELLRVENLHTYFFTENRVIKAVEGVSLTVNEGEVVGVVGESGCGKSITALSIMKLVPSPGRYVNGRVYFKGRDLLQLPEKELQKIRGKEISMIFQEPMTALNPVFTVGYQIEEVLKVHTKLDTVERKKKVLEIMAKVGLPDPEKRYKEYPHQLSGGLRQRVMIAMALVMTPPLVIADEPTTALDVTIQKQILGLIKNLKEEFGLSMIFISHDMGVIKEIADRVYIMYAGKVVEEGTKKEIFENPLHPYTKGLILSIPPVNFEEKKKPLQSIPGVVPDPSNKPLGCFFHPRCESVMDICKEKIPPYYEITPTHKVRCFLYDR